MESRRIVLLSKAYFDGRLDLKLKTSFSRRRESYILHLIEMEELKKCTELQAIVEATFAAAMRTKETTKLAFDTLGRYREIALPYAKKQDIVEIDDMSKMKELHQKNIEAFSVLLAARKEPAKE